ncbi:hypothetical protein HMPREF0591_1022 [Mycobacterium parascrofulaceum ATCC BAA-614]|uniref:Uncharacterized protein n=2 Tax=Mycobacterium parascrofulaceum TaxID=240125 RepID=D5P4C8_9MYCO|nr:hypothetical protein HMPREF0591_1022 [Mycobacterium parascrofulaceum ATCC BAA-614]
MSAMDTVAPVSTEVMINTVTTVVVALLGVHIIAKFFFFALPYAKRRRALDASYGDRPSATSTADWVLLIFTILLCALLLWRGVEAVSFLGGLWIGATLIQLYFHRFHDPVPAERAAPPPASPLKEMSYAIQSWPWRAWPQMAVLAVLVAWNLTLILH